MRIYCKSDEGVAIQTTLARLQESVGDVPVNRVTYQTPGLEAVTPTLLDLVTKKRPMFAYEREVQVVFHSETPNTEEAVGHTIKWDPGKNLESIRVHPEADQSFMQTVTAIVEQYAPSLKGAVLWSAMSESPPF